MTPLVAILLTPPLMDSYGLVASGRAGARPPLARRQVTPEGPVFTLLTPSEPLEPWHSLVVAWDSAPVLEGLDRLGRCLAVREGFGVQPTPPRLVESSNGDCFVLWPEGKQLPIYYGKTKTPVGCNAVTTPILTWTEQHPPEALRNALHLAQIAQFRLGGTLVLLRAPSGAS